MHASIVNAAASAPKPKPSSDRKNRSCALINPIAKPTPPASHDNVAAGWLRRAMSAWASVSAKINAPLPTASNPRSRLPEREVGAEEQTSREVTKREAAGHADDADRDHNDHEPAQCGAQCGAEFVGEAGTGQVRELREQRGLHRLEPEDRDAGDEDARGELPDPVRLRGGFPAFRPMSPNGSSTTSSTNRSSCKAHQARGMDRSVGGFRMCPGSK